ncbi:UNVERIFIED_CONTAM: hypothetical protein PYX00_000068 [Menopon gallinae]|uniref:Uncharacterized protein n=1 Tax=Menopon gallinae TaxID=328185 RepID=A0AAW2I7I0_9NEOP
MDNKLSKLKENQQLIGSKINMLRETNKKKDEEAEKIRELIAECRENLNRMKNDAMNDKSKGKGASGANRHEISPCLDRDGTSHGGQKSPCGNRGVEDICSKLRQQYSEDRRRHQSVAGSSGGRDDDPCSKYKTNSTLNQRKTSSGDNDPCSKYRQGSPCSKYQSGEMDGPCKSVTDKISTQMSALANAQEISRQCIEQMGEKMEKEMRMRITTVSSCQDGSGRSPCDEISESLQKRVSCKVDLSKMKVNIKGAPEDLKKLDAVQLVNLLDKYHCQELVIKTGSKTAKAPGKEIPIFYILHPGNVVLILGILLVAFLINSNLCDPCRGHNGKLFISMLYVSSLAFHCGTILWMSFIREIRRSFLSHHQSF